MGKRRLYERAAATRGAPRSLWFVGDGASVFAGPLHHNAAHQHSVPVLLTGLYGAFRLGLGHQPWTSCRMAVVPAGVTYEFDMAGEALSVVYLEPSQAGVAALVPLLRGGREIGGGLAGEIGEIGPLRELFEDQTSAQWAGQALHDLLAFAAPRARRRIDPRVARALRELQTNAGEQRPVAEAATIAGLSASRFQHVFAAEVGVPYRRYRGWQRMLAAIRVIGRGDNFTAAAHAAGYADQAHFAHDFRRMFGASATPSLVNVRG